jgi:hypothetical protein
MNSDKFDSADHSPLSFHAARIQALQRSRTSANTEPSSPASNATPVHPLLTEILQHLGESAQHTLAHRWHHISDLSNDLSLQMTLQAELQTQLQLVEQRVSGLKQEINALLSEAQDTAEQELTQARMRAEISRLTHNKLSARLQLA